MADDECCEVVVTADDPDWLAGFTRTLVAGNLDYLNWIATETVTLSR